MKRVTWAIVCAAIALTTAGCERFRFFGGGGGNYKRVKLNIVLVMQDGRCVAKQPLQGHAQQNKDTVMFQVKNQCDTTYYVKFWHFRKINPDTLDPASGDTAVFKADPITSDERGNAVAVTANGNGNASGQVNDLGIGSQDDPPVFKYMIAISTSPTGPFNPALDPDFEIWP